MAWTAAVIAFRFADAIQIVANWPSALVVQVMEKFTTAPEPGSEDTQ